MLLISVTLQRHFVLMKVKDLKGTIWVHLGLLFRIMALMNGMDRISSEMDSLTP